jgi:hypothetical protein
MGMEKAYPYLFYSRSPTMHARQGPLTTTRMAFLLEQGSNLYTYAPWLFDVSSARSVADVNAQAKVRVEQMPPEKIKWLVETFASKRGLARLNAALAKPTTKENAAFISDILAKFRTTGNKLPYTNEERRLSRSHILGAVQCLGLCTSILTPPPQ